MEDITKRVTRIFLNKEISIVVVLVADLVVAAGVVTFMKEIYLPPEMIILNKSTNKKAQCNRYGTTEHWG